MFSLKSSPIVMRGHKLLTKSLNSSLITKQSFKSLLFSNQFKSGNIFVYKDSTITRLVPKHLANYRKYQSFGKIWLKSVISSDDYKKYERNLSTNSTKSLKSKTINRSESQIKLLNILSKSSIDSFPLLKDKDFNIKHFQKEFKDLFKGLKVCEKNNLMDSLYYPSVTTILNATMSVQSLIALNKWKKLKIMELGEQGFKDYQKNIFLRGRLLHTNIENFIQNRDDSTLVLNESVQKIWQSLSPVLKDFHDVQFCETPVYHPFLCYKGIVDCVAHYSGKLVIIEWKTSEKLKPSLKDIYDNPLQAVAYLGAINYETKHCLPIDEVVLVYAYEDGSKAQIHYLSVDQCHNYWRQWLSRVKSYWDLIVFKQNTN